MDGAPAVEGRLDVEGPVAVHHVLDLLEALVVDLEGGGNMIM